MESDIPRRRSNDSAVSLERVISLRYSRKACGAMSVTAKGKGCTTSTTSRVGSAAASGPKVATA